MNCGSGCAGSLWVIRSTSSLASSTIVISVVGAKPAEECDHFPLHKAAVRHAEFLAQGNAHGRRGAENDNLAGIPDRRPD